MIVEWLMQTGAGFANWVVSLFPSVTFPSGLAHLDSTLSGIISLGAGVGVFVDWGYVGVIAGIPLSIWGLGILVKAIRALLAHIPFVGGKG